MGAYKHRKAIGRCIGRFVNNNIYLLPPIMLIATLLSKFIDYNFVIVGNIVGYSLFTDVVFISMFLLQRKRYCWFTRISVLALPIMNLVNITGYYLDYEFYQKFFVVSIFAITVFLSLFLTYKKYD